MWRSGMCDIVLRSMRARTMDSRVCFFVHHLTVPSLGSSPYLFYPLWELPGLCIGVLYLIVILCSVLYLLSPRDVPWPWHTGKAEENVQVSPGRWGTGSEYEICMQSIWYQKQAAIFFCVPTWSSAAGLGIHSWECLPTSLGLWVVSGKGRETLLLYDIGGSCLDQICPHRVSTVLGVIAV